MSLRATAVNFRASEETLRQIEDIKVLFTPLMADRSSTLRWIVKTMWMLLFTDASLAEIFQTWQVLHRQKAASDVTQLQFEFPRAHTGCEMFPRIWGPFSGGHKQ